MKTSTNRKNFKDMTFQELTQNQTENIFFKFMDFGRKGIEMAAENLVLSVLEFQNADKEIKKSLSKIKYQEIIDYAVKELTNSLITQGTKGFEAVIVSVSTSIANTSTTPTRFKQY